LDGIQLSRQALLLNFYLKTEQVGTKVDLI